MVGVTTVALIERRPDISRSLFSRYWRDVHGVMAARIPGFDSYTQYHVTPTAPGSPPFEGIAIVTFKSEADRQGLATSEVTQHIHRDEQNVFRRALLYNLEHDAHEVLVGSPDRAGEAMFVVVPLDEDPGPLIARLRMDALYLATYDLSGGDPSAWNQTDTTGPACGLLVHGIWPEAAAAADGLAGHRAYRVDAAHLMVASGMPTTVGLRGLDAANTIAEAGADNQLSAEVIRAVYGQAAAR